MEDNILRLLWLRISVRRGGNEFRSQDLGVFSFLVVDILQDYEYG